MSTPFSTGELLKSVSNYPITKGDVAGHPFHGNQYENAESLANRASDLEKEMEKNGYSNHSPKEFADAHRDLAMKHERLAKSALDRIGTPAQSRDGWKSTDRDTQLKIAREHLAAAAAHNQAARVHDNAATDGGKLAQKYAAFNTASAADASRYAELVNDVSLQEPNWARINGETSY